MIGIICALHEELESLISFVSLDETVSSGGWVFYLGTLQGKRVVLSKCGVGKVNAAGCTQMMISVWKVKLIVCSGVAGALIPELSIGDVCIASSTVQHDMDTTYLGDPRGSISPGGKIFFECPSWILSIVDEISKESFPRPLTVGVIASGDQFIFSTRSKVELSKTFGACAVDMESGAISYICYLNKVDCLIIRSISDSLVNHSNEYNDFLSIATENSTAFLLEFLNKISFPL